MRSSSIFSNSPKPRGGSPFSGLFITGTDTGVGKTYVAAMIARALVKTGRSVGVYKPVASGCRREGGELVSDDAVALWEAAGRPGELGSVCPQLFEAPLAPHLAAQAAGQNVDAGLLRQGREWWRDRCDIVLVEGVGGLMSPISEKDYNVDLAREFELPLVIVAPNQLGVINQALQTLITASTCGLAIAGIVLNDTRDDKSDPSRASNRQEIESRGDVPFLAHVGHEGSQFDESVDWFGLTIA